MRALVHDRGQSILGVRRVDLSPEWGGNEDESVCSRFRRNLAGSRCLALVFFAAERVPRCLSKVLALIRAMGRLDEGLAESREAARLDPLSVQPFHDMAINALIRTDFEKAAAGVRHTIKIDSDWTWGYIKLARSLSLEKKCNEAFAQAEIAERRIAGGVGALFRAWLGSTYATCGDVNRARQKLGELQAFQAKGYVDPATFADIYASLGEIDEAVSWFQKAYEDRSPDMVYAQVGSRLNPQLAANVGYRAIMDKMAFPPSAK
jgi:tetratricopeptide (TPR) repeat protein